MPMIQSGLAEANFRGGTQVNIRNMICNINKYIFSHFYYTKPPKSGGTVPHCPQ